MSDNNKNQETPAEQGTDTENNAVADAANVDAFAGVDMNADPVEGNPEPDPDMQSRYGDIVPDVLQQVLPSGEEGQPENAAPEGNVPPSAEGQTDGQQPATNTPAVQPEVSPEVAAMQAQINTLQNLLTQSNQTTTNASKEQKSTEGEIPGYDFEVPDQLIASLASEEPAERKQAIVAIMKGVAQTVHTQVAQTINSVRDSMPSTIQQYQQVAHQQQQVNTEFYGAYPQLSDASLRPIVKTIGEQVMMERQAKGLPIVWDATLMKEIGDRASLILKKQPAPATPAPTPAAFGGNAGGGANAPTRIGTNRTTQQQLMDEL